MSEKKRIGLRKINLKKITVVVFELRPKFGKLSGFFFRPLLRQPLLYLGSHALINCEI